MVSRMVSCKAVNSFILVFHVEWIALHALLLSLRCSLSWAIPVDWSAAGPGSSYGVIFVGASPVVVLEGIFVVVAVLIARNTTNALYEFFVVFLFLVLGVGSKCKTLY